jgi:hypothetical protein
VCFKDQKFRITVLSVNKASNHRRGQGSSWTVEEEEEEEKEEKEKEEEE